MKSGNRRQPEKNHVLDLGVLSCGCSITHFSTMPTLAEQLNKANCLVIDVRSTDERACGDAYKGSKNIPIGELAARVSECGDDKNRPIVCYCAAGMRAASAARVLKEHGFGDVISAANAGALRACKPDH